jgi:hypothetical protein
VEEARARTASSGLSAVSFAVVRIQLRLPFPAPPLLVPLIHLRVSRCRMVLSEPAWHVQFRDYLPILSYSDEHEC